ncbi:hypothetical protein ACFX1X_022330 [Malus domestica]
MKVTDKCCKVQASLVWNDTQMRPWMMVGTRLLKLFKVGIMEENWKEDLRETTGSYPVSEAMATVLRVQGRVVVSLWQKVSSMPSSEEQYLSGDVGRIFAEPRKFLGVFISCILLCSTECDLVRL